MIVRNQDANHGCEDPFGWGRGHWHFRIGHWTLLQLGPRGPPRERGKCNGDSLSCGPTGGHPDKPLTGGRMFKEGQLAVFHQAIKGPRALWVPLAARGVARLFKLWDACCQAPKRLACLL